MNGTLDSLSACSGSVFSGTNSFGGLGSFDAEPITRLPTSGLDATNSFDGETAGLQTMGDYPFVLDRGGSVDSTSGMDPRELLAMRQVSQTWGPTESGGVAPGGMQEVGADGYWLQGSAEIAYDDKFVDDFERAISEGMDKVSLGTPVASGAEQGATMLSGIMEENVVFGSAPGVEVGHGLVQEGCTLVPQPVPNYGQGYVVQQQQPPPGHLMVDPAYVQQQHQGGGPPMQHMQHHAQNLYPAGNHQQMEPEIPRRVNSGGVSGPSPTESYYTSSGPDSPASPNGRTDNRAGGRGQPIQGSAMLPPMLKRRLSKVGPIGLISPVVALPVEQEMDEEELELLVLQNNGDESEEGKAARRKLQNRLAQRRRRKRNSMCVSMSNVYEPQSGTLLDQAKNPDDGPDQAMVRRRRKSTDFVSDEERLEWRRAQNREAKRRYRERRKSESVAGTGDPMATLQFLEELRMFSAAQSSMGGAAGPGPGPVDGGGRPPADVRRPMAHNNKFPLPGVSS